MDFVMIFLIAVSLAMDAFAASVCKGLCMKGFSSKQGTIIALFFGGFQALMPFLGFYLGKSFGKYVAEYDHWVAFLLLLYIGGKMLYDTLTSGDEKVVCPVDGKLNIKEILILAVATSIDAFAVGITLAFYKTVNIYASILIIGITTFVISFGGVAIGYKFGTKFKKKAEVFGGVILVLIGLKILLEGLGVM